MTRIRTWLDETHGSGFELVRHFISRTFDSEMFSVPGEWQKVAAGLAAMLLSSGILALTTFMQSFNIMRDKGLSPLQIYGEMRGDELAFIAVAMGVTALLTSLVWESLFPSLRDCMALAGLPLGSRRIFLAKSCALLLVFAAFVIAFNLPWAIMFAAATSGNWWPNTSAAAQIAANFAATAGVCVFVFFSLMACQGILLNVLPSRMFTRVSLFVQATVFIATLGLLPFIGRQPTAAAWWPPVWFLGLWEAIVQGSWSTGRAGVFAMIAPAVLAALAYLISYQRYRRVLLEAQPEPPPERKSGVGSWLLERWIGNPREEAIFGFIWKTLARSRGHRLILLAYGGIALGVITKSALDMPRPSLRNEGMYGLLVVLAPLSVAMLVTVGLRYLFRLPESRVSNWIFQTVDRKGCAAWLAAAERFVVYCGIGPVLFTGCPAAIAILGLMRGAAATLLALFAALLWFEVLFRKWQKLPFTCSYLPDQRPIWLTLMRYAFGIPFLGALGQLILYSSGEPTAFAALSTLEAAVWWKLRSTRRSTWSQSVLVYEELPEDAIMALDLQPATDQQAESTSTSSLQPEAEIFAKLTASRGILPAEWAEEIAGERHSAMLVETLVEDVRYALRLIRRNPLVSAVVVLTLTVGIGINASVFTVVNGLALRPHVYKDPDSFLRVFPMFRFQSTTRPVSYTEYVALRDQSRSLKHLAAFTNFPALIGDDDSIGSAGIAVSCNFFAVEGLDRPIVGRLFNAEDCRTPGQLPVAVISESLWRSRFGANKNQIDRTIQINSRPVILAGVVPDRTSGWTRPPSVWLPYTALPYFDPSHNPFATKDSLWLMLAGRLAPGASRAQAQAELNLLVRQQDTLHPGRNSVVVVTNGSWAADWELSTSTRGLMLVSFFIGTFNLVLFISCANVATLMLSRAAARKREIALRLSLGAPRIRLVRMLVTETVALAAIAGIASLYLAKQAPLPLYHLLVTGAPDFPMPTDWRTFVYISVVVLAAGILSGLAPALECLKLDLTGSIKGTGGFLFGAATGNRLRSLLVSVQVALSMVLLVEAGLFARSEDRALRSDPGYSPQKLVVTRLWFPDNSTIQSARVRLHAIEERMRALPGVRSVAFSDGWPLVDRDTVELRPPTRRDASQPVDVYAASPGFFQTVGIPILRGREFQESDGSAAVISESLALAFWRGRDPIGRTLELPSGAVQVVGVARDIEPMRIGGSENPPVYILRRVQAHDNVMSVRFDAGASTGALAVRNALHQSDPDLFVFPRLFQKVIDQITDALWNVVGFMLILGIVGTVLAATGIYGAVSFAVTQRTKELGIRVALGATKLQIVREVFVSGGRPVLHGLVVGLWMSVAVAAGLRETVNGPILRIDSSEPLLYCAAALVLGASAILAMLGPARRGASSDPLDALRCE